MVTDTKRNAVIGKVVETGKPSSFTRKPGTLKKGTSSWPPIMPIGIGDLNIETIFASLGLTQS